MEMRGYMLYKISKKGIVNLYLFHKDKKYLENINDGKYQIAEYYRDSDGNESIKINNSFIKI